MKFKHIYLFLLLLGILSMILGMVLASPTDTNPNLKLNFLEVLSTNSKIHLNLLVSSIFSFGIQSFLFVMYQFFIVGFLIGGTSQVIGIYSSLSFFWVHGIIELLATVMVASIVPYLLINIVLRLFKKSSDLSSVNQTVKFIGILIFINFILVFLSALLECYIAPFFTYQP